MSLTLPEKVHGIIHTAAASTAAVGAGLAQLPVSDAIPITAIQLSMISAIALIHGRTISEAQATALLGTFAATMGGRTISQLLIGWIPGIGNAINASTAAAVTEAVGWAAHKYFENLGNEPDAPPPNVLVADTVLPRNPAITGQGPVSGIATAVAPALSAVAQVTILYAGRFIPLDVALDLVLNGQFIGSGSFRNGINLSLNVPLGIHHLELRRRSSNFLLNTSMKLTASFKKEACSLDLRVPGRYTVIISGSRMTGSFSFKLTRN